MIQYQLRPIFINGSHRGKELAAVAQAFSPVLPADWTRWLNSQAARLTYAQDDRPVSKAYEERIRVTLNEIGRTTIGRALFDSLDTTVPVWIVPYGRDDCNAVTGQRSSDLNKGVAIQYSPETWAFDRCGSYPGYRPVESLFHEMVHASRITNYGHSGTNHKFLKGMKDYEEFLAVMLTNMFRSEQNAKKLNRDYLTGTLQSQAEVEQYLSSDPVLIKALAYFSSDPLVMLVKHLKMPFNPFRDFDRLLAASKRVP